jgi:hypothetical protein
MAGKVIPTDEVGKVAIEKFLVRNELGKAKLLDEYWI